MKERAILFSAPMVRAILAGTKTQTRRVVKLPHMNPLGQWEPTRFGGLDGGQLRDGSTIPEQGGIWHTRTGDHLGCPYGQPGDRLWLRESFQTHIGPFGESLIYAYKATDDERLGPWRSPIHMPRQASRITLEVTGVRVERLQDISEKDAIAEGIEPTMPNPGHWNWKDYLAEGCQTHAVLSYKTLWESINGPGSWDANPWVWVVEFKVLEP